MSPTPTYPKLLKATFTGAATNDPVIVTNNRTGERIEKQNDALLRLESKSKSIIIQLDNFSSGWQVGDVITVSIGGTKAGTSSVTLTASSNRPQTTTVTAAAVNTSVKNI